MGRSPGLQMILLVVVIASALVVGLLFRGSIRRFEQLHLGWWGLAIAGLGMQFLPLPSGENGTDLVVRVATLACSYALLVAFAARNARLPGMWFVLLGLALNAAVILPNGGMPVSREAVSRAGQRDMLELLVEQGAAKHHLMDEDDLLTPLADVIAIPRPIGAVISVGDVFVYGGIAWLIVAAMRGRTRPAGFGGPYRGKHRRGSATAPAPTIGPLRAPATTSGSAR